METKIKRFEEIEQLAISNYLNKTDFNISDWIDEDEIKEWILLGFEINNQCPLCCEEEKQNCECLQNITK